MLNFKKTLLELHFGEKKSLPIRSFFGAIVFFSCIAFFINIGSYIIARSMEPSFYSEKKTLHEFKIANNWLLIPENTILSKKEDENGKINKLDIYLHWPDMNGYSKQEYSDFNYITQRKRILFLSFEEGKEWHDMNSRLQMVYRDLIEKKGYAGPGGLTLYPFKKTSGYLNEELAIQEKRKGTSFFIARCLSNPFAKRSLAGCQRDIRISNTLTLSYRFPRELLSQWPQIEMAVIRKVKKMLRKQKGIRLPLQERSEPKIAIEKL